MEVLWNYYGNELLAFDMSGCQRFSNFSLKAINEEISNDNDWRCDVYLYPSAQGHNRSGLALAMLISLQ